MNKYPIYIPSKGRYEKKLRTTSLYLDEINVPYKLVVEPDEYDKYLKEVKDKSKLMVLDMAYKKKYDTCDDYGTKKSTGSGPARNFIWDYAKKNGFKYHWCMDDNIRSLQRITKNRKITVSNPIIIKLMEDFVERYKNVAIAGPQYDYFHPSGVVKKPFNVNARIYSCLLINTNIPFRWRGRHNEDTILSLDVLKAGWCTILFNAFLQQKQTTMTMKGGNTEEFYKDSSRLYVSKLLQKVHPDYTKVVKRYRRWHHQVDYSSFTQKLIRKEKLVKKGHNNYGLKLVTKKYG